jgi:hypothetical protein
VSKAVIYARVSSTGDRQNTERQVVDQKTIGGPYYTGNSRRVQTINQDGSKDQECVEQQMIRYWSFEFGVQKYEIGDKIIDLSFR